MADDVRRWSEELAREPGSLVFLQLGEALRRQQRLDLAHKIALRGLERHPHNADAHDLLARIAADRGALARAYTPPAPTNDPRRLFETLLVDDGQTALLLDANGLVLGGVYIDGHGTDVAQDVGAQLSGISDEVRRSTKYLDVGEWRSITFETRGTVVAMAPVDEGGLLVVAASKVTPLGLLRRLLDRCAMRASTWLREGRIEPGSAQ